jgi:hypothetical protein
MKIKLPEYQSTGVHGVFQNDSVVKAVSRVRLLTRGWHCQARRPGSEGSLASFVIPSRRRF